MKNGEHNLQEGCIKWFRLQYPQYAKRLFAVPNAGKRANGRGKYFVREGLTKGVSDLILLIPNKHYSGMVIEMKYGKNKLTPDQKTFLHESAALGYKALVCYSLETFIKQLSDYMKCV